jgi:hypothetical protein
MGCISKYLGRIDLPELSLCFDEVNSHLIHYLLVKGGFVSEYRHLGSGCELLQKSHSFI